MILGSQAQKLASLYSKQPQWTNHIRQKAEFQLKARYADKEHKKALLPFKGVLFTCIPFWDLHNSAT